MTVFIRESYINDPKLVIIQWLLILGIIFSIIFHLSDSLLLINDKEQFNKISKYFYACFCILLSICNLTMNKINQCFLNILI